MLVGTFVETFDLGREFIQRRRLFQRRGVEPVVALDGVNMRVDAGRCLALVGPNGAGKSTLLRILATTISPTSGGAMVCGHDVSAHPAAVRSRVGIAGNADRSFFWPLTGIENLVFFGQLAGLTHSEAIEAAEVQIERVGLGNAAHNRVSGYSAGMRQRLGLARALLHQPPVLLLDEPTANLDAEYRDVAVEIIASAVRSGRTVIVATHDPGLVSATATETLRLENGRVAAEDETETAVRYLIQLAPDGEGNRSPELLQVEDLGDGHVLSAALNQVIESGRDILSVEKQ